MLKNFQIMLLSLIFLPFLVFSSPAIASTLAGPAYPPPGGASMSQNGTSGDNLIGKSGGKTWTFTNVVLADKATTYWGPSATGIRLSFDGPEVTGAEAMIFQPGLSNLAIGKAVWTGLTQMSGPWGGGTFETRFTMTFTNDDGSPLSATAVGDVGLSANVGAVVPVTTSIMTFKANIIFEAYYPGYPGSSVNWGANWGPALDVYDYYHYNWHLPPGSTAWSTYNAGFYFANTTPSISDTTDQLVQQDGSTGALAFTVGDTESDPAIDPTALTVSATSSNGALIPVGNIVFAGSGSDRTVTITPNAGMSGTSTITLTVVDGSYTGKLTASDSFVVTVNAPPRLTANSALSVDRGISAVITTTNLNSADNESAADSRTFTVGFEGNGGPPRNGVLKLNGTPLAADATFTQDDINNDRLSYVHSDNCETADDFQFNINDGNGGVTPTGINVVYSFGISITQPNRPPVTHDGSVGVALNNLYSGTLSGSDDDCTAQALTFRIETLPTKGIVELTNPGTGAFNYTPNPGETGADSFTFQVNDGIVDAMAVGTFTFDIANQAPVAAAAAKTTLEDAALNGTLSAIDLDLPPQTLTYSIASNGSKGTATLTDATTGAYTYTPDAGAIGVDSFSFTASDGLLTSAPATVTVTIRPVIAPGDIIVANGRVEGSDTTLIFVDPLTAQQAIISSGDKFNSLHGIAVEADGKILVIDDTNNSSRLLRVDPADGSQSILNAGPFAMAVGVAVEADGNILVGCMSGLLRIDPVTGGILNTFSGDNLDFPAGVKVAPDGQIFVSDVGAFASKPSQIVKIDPVSGDQTVISEGGSLAVPADLVIARSGWIFAADGPMGNSNVLSIDPASGDQAVLAGSNLLDAPSGIGISGEQLVVTNTNNNSLVTVNMTTGVQTLLAAGDLIKKPWGLAVVNYPPTVTPLSHVYIQENGIAGPLDFSVGDVEIDTAYVTLTGSSSNQVLVPDANILFAGSGSARTITVTPAADVVGDTLITVKAGDGLTETLMIFTVTVDGTAPVPAVPSMNDGATLTNSPAVNVSLAATDDILVTGYFLSESSVTPTSATSGWVSITATNAFTNETSFDLNSGDGQKTIYVWYQDAAGNISGSTSASITLDTTGPFLAGIVPADGAWNSLAEISITGTVDDINSSVSSLTINGLPVVIDNGGFSHPTILVAGVNTFVAVATDILGNETRRVLIFNLDTIVPNIEISALPDGSHTNEDTINVTGFVADADGIQAVLVGSDPVSTDADGNFSVAISLVPGDNLIEITAVDLAGNQTTVTRTIIYDADAPAVAITAPVDNQQTARSFIDLTGTADADAVITMTDNAGNPVTVSRTGGNFSATVNLDYGMNTITITITDPVSGATNTVKRTIVSNFYSPGLGITTPVRDVTIRNNEITLQGLVSDAQTEVTLTITAGGNMYTPSVDEDGSFSQSLTFSEEGVYPVLVIVEDLYGNSAKVQRNVQFLRGSVVINKGAATTTKTTVTLDLSYLPPAPATSASKMQLLYNNKSWTAPLTFVSKQAITLPGGDGIKKVYVRYLDDAGVPSAFYTDTVILDTMVPMGVLSINAGATATTQANVTLNLAVTDANGVVKMQFSDNGTVWGNLEPFATKRAYTLPGSYGLKKVYVRFVDSAGKISAIVNDTIFYVATVPSHTSAQLIIKNGDAYTTAAAVPLTIVSPGPEYTLMQISLNGTTWSAWETVKTSKSATLPAGDGVKIIYVQFKTTANVISSTYSDSIILDTKAPLGTIQINGGNFATNTRNVTIMLTASDLNGVKEMQFSTDGTLWTAPTAFAATKQITLSAGEGVKSVKVKFIDNAGKTSIVYADTIIVDTLPPTSGKVVINGGAAQTKVATVKLTLSAVTASYFKVSFDEGSTWGRWEPYSTSATVTIPGTSGTKKIMIVYRDYLGNESAPCSDTIIFDTVAPTGTLLIRGSEPTNTYTRTAAVTLELTQTDLLPLQIHYRTHNGTTWSAWTGYVTYPLTNLLKVTLPAGNGARQVEVQYKDAVGIESDLQSSITDSITLDTTVPVLPTETKVQINDDAETVSYNSAGGTGTLLPLTLTVPNPTETGSGVAAIRWSSNGTTWSADQPWSEDGSFSIDSPLIPPPALGVVKAVYVKIVDKAGNLSATYTDTIKVIQ